MHAASFENSARLQRFLGVLADGKEHSTRELVMKAHICAANSIASELRANGFNVVCRQGVDGKGQRCWFYRLASREPSPGGLRGEEPAAGSVGHPLPARPVSSSGSLVTAGGSREKGAA